MLLVKWYPQVGWRYAHASILSGESYFLEQLDDVKIFKKQGQITEYHVLVAITFILFSDNVIR
jgi:hypothetical protein